MLLKQSVSGFAFLALFQISLFMFWTATGMLGLVARRFSCTRSVGQGFGRDWDYR